MMHPIYLPFTEQKLLSHFANIKQNGECIKNVKHLDYYKDNIQRYKEYLANTPDRLGIPLKEMKEPCQIEKDERFWIVACMMTIFYSQNRRQELAELFRNAYGDIPQINGLTSWDECFGEDLHLFFEPNLPSPSSFKDLNSFDFPPYIKKIDLSSLFGLLSCRGECPYKKKSFSLSVERVGGNC